MIRFSELRDETRTELIEQDSHMLWEIASQNIEYFIDRCIDEMLDEFKREYTVDFIYKEKDRIESYYKYRVYFGKYITYEKALVLLNRAFDDLNDLYNDIHYGEV